MAQEEDTRIRRVVRGDVVPTVDEIHEQAERRKQLGILDNGRKLAEILMADPLTAVLPEGVILAVAAVLAHNGAVIR